MRERSKLKTWVLDVLVMLLGAVIYGMAVSVFSSPNNIAPGGVSGIAILLHYALGTPVGVMVFLINIPIIIWAVMEIGYKLVIKTFLGIAMASLMIDVVPHFVGPYRGNMILVCLLSGAFEGVGLSLVFLRGGTTGGTDVVARLLARRFPQVSMGKMMLAVDGVIILVSTFVYGSVDNGVYACIVIFVSTHIIDAILYGSDAGTGKLFFVMSPKVRQMGDRIMTELDRGVTYLDSRGGYTQEPGETLICAVRRFEVYQIQSIIRQEDRNAFVIVGDAGEITGEGFRPVRSDDKPLKEILQNLKERQK